MEKVNWANPNDVIAYAKELGPQTLVVQWPGRPHFNIVRYVNNFNFVEKMKGHIIYMVGVGE